MKSWTDRSETTARILGWSGLKEQDMQLPGFIAKAAIGVAFLVFAPMFRAQPANIASEYSPVLGTQQQGSISITDPAESNTYRMAVSQADPKVRAAGLEGFLTAYPQSVVKSVVLARCWILTLPWAMLPKCFAPATGCFKLTLTI